ncbi:MAG: hypothetical protein HZB18_18680 [Chloroflexi bacterium]|nr:hypothetical protein [Chloroflexota bacterium]
MKTKQKSLALAVVLILSLLLTTVAYAGTTSVSGGVGDANCTASKTITQSSSYWTAYVRSQCDLGIGVIGYTSWTVRQYCPMSGSYTVRFQSSVGDVNTNTNTFQRAISNIQYATGCGNGYIRLHDMGRHDFKTILNIWRPSVTRNEMHVY